MTLGTIIVGAIVLAIVAGIVTDMVRKKRRGQCVSCDCGCDNCPSKGSCKV